MANRTQELAGLLPYTVRDKFRYYLGYVSDRLIDMALEEGVYHRLKELRDEVDLIFLVRLLYGYFVVGFRNYEEMLGFFDRKEVKGFQIGSTVFTRQSPITFEWQRITNELENLVNRAGMAFYVRPTVSVDEVLRRIIRSLSDESVKAERDS